MIVKKRFFFFSGKGGVGKTTVSCAFGVLLADKGYRTLVVSLDPAHSLSLTLDTQLSPGKETEVTNNLYALELDIDKEMRDYLKRIEREAEKVVSPVILEELKLQLELAYYSPGAFELAMLDAIHRILKEKGKHYDKIVFDTAPSGYTVRLLSLPRLFEKWITELIKLREEANRYRKMAGEKREDRVVELLKKRLKQFYFLRDTLTGRDSFFSVVVNPGILPVSIGKRTAEELKKAGIECDLLIVNKAELGYSVSSSVLQCNELLYISKFEKEPRGLKALRELTTFID